MLVLRIAVRIAFACVLLVLLGAQVSPAGAIQDESTMAELRTEFERICVESSPAYELDDCENWLATLSSQDFNYITKQYFTGNDSDIPNGESDVGIESGRDFPRSVRGEKIGSRHFQGVFLIDKSYLRIPAWHYEVTHEWCINKKETKIKTGCNNSWSMPTTWVVWDYVDSDERARRSNANNRTWTRVYYRGHFKSSAVGGISAVNCWPEMQLTAHANDGKRFDVDFAYLRC